MATQSHPTMTLEEYLDRERAAEGKSEYHAGYVYAMSGGSEKHARLAFRLAYLIENKSADSCRVYCGDLNLYLKEHDKCVYPDVMAICGEPQFWKTRNDVITNPTLVAEVLSPSTQHYDRSSKVPYYQSLPSLQHLLLLSQEKRLIEHTARQNDGSWLVTHHASDQPLIQIQALGIEITLAEIYRNILS